MGQMHTADGFTCSTNGEANYRSQRMGSELQIRYIGVAWMYTADVLHARNSSKAQSDMVASLQKIR